MRLLLVKLFSNRKFIFIFTFSFLFFNYSFLQNSKVTEIKTQSSKPEFLKSDTSWVDSVYNSLTWEERIGQLFMVAAYSNKGADHKKYIANLIKNQKIGGLIFFQGGPRRQIELYNYYQSISKVPLLIGFDGEWGLGMRLDSTISYPRQMLMGAVQDNHLIYQFGEQVAEQCQRVGIHVNFAPVIDVNNNPKNPVINNRSFGESRENVALKGAYYMKGMQDHNLLCTGKHFPGHGDTDTDSHYDLPLIKHSRKRIDSLELYPFKYLINNGLNGIMVAHLNIPSLDTTPNLASTLSANVVDKLLKQRLGFQGLIFTDALNMKGASKYFQPGEVDLRALKAGNDVLLYPEDIPIAVSTIMKAIKSGELDSSRVEESCKKILHAKKWIRLDTLKEIPLSNLHNDLHKPEYLILKNKIVKSAITLVKNDKSILPLQRLDTLKIAAITFGNEDKSIHKETLSKYTKIAHFSIEKETTNQEIDEIKKMLNKYNLVIATVYASSRRPNNNYGIEQKYIQCINELSVNKKLVLNILANPYSLNYWKNYSKIDAVIMGYYPTPETEQYTAEAIFGGIGCEGRLPISAGGFPYRTGSDTKKTRLNHALPEETGMNSKILQRIDSVAALAISEKATPGCQVLVAKNGSIVYEKAYGYHTYSNYEEVELSHLYDLASITKISATAPSLMKLVDEGKFFLDSTLAYYLPELDTTNKGNLTIRDILTHRAGLKSWIPFYLSLVEGYDSEEEQTVSKYYSRYYPNKIGNAAYLKRNYKFRDSLLSDVPTDTFSFLVAKDLYINKYFRDSIFDRIRKSEVKEEKEYLYSDLGYYYLKVIIQNITKQPLEEYVNENFYSRLGANTLGYIPLERFPVSEIVPTEKDIIFRKQLIRGYVHDPGAAMLNLVGGHAGLFSNANDLAKLMQMYLQFGYYGGERYISSSTMQQFTTCQFCPENRRGIAFDKPHPDTSKVLSISKGASLSSFGHSGFTGTLTWVDPEEELIYIFLSNRIHPDAENKQIYKLNIRPAIHDLIYEAIKN